jgi:hypothetical protein
VKKDSVKTGVAENDFEYAFGGRIPLENRVDLFPDGSKHLSI